MEAIVEVIKGELNFLNKKCSFCDKEATLLSGVVNEIRYDDTARLKTLPICKKHFDKLNAILIGEFDIDNIFLKEYSESNKIGRVKLRKHPPIEIAKTKNKIFLQKCSFIVDKSQIASTLCFQILDFIFSLE